MVHYFEEEAVSSYTSYLQLIESGQIEDIPAPQLAIDYYEALEPGAKLSDMIRCVRADEQKHANANLRMAGGQAEGLTSESTPASEVPPESNASGLQA